MPSRASRNGKAPRPKAGVVGLGLMGTSIAACLLATGHQVIGIDRDPKKRRASGRHLLALLREMKRERLLSGEPAAIARRFAAFEDFAELRDCGVVIEAVFENLELKRQVIAQVEAVVTPKCLIGSNTSALPVTQLQQGARHPERILGIHWAEPAHITRFMEVICGDRTSPDAAQRVMRLARGWGKEPTLVRRDVRGFITNRIMYAMLREAFYLVENGYATPADVDRSVRNDYGYWMTLAGPFRFMDLTGIPAYAAVMRDLWPDLSCATEVPALMKKVVDSGAVGIGNAKGFYKYTEADARRWEKRFLKFTYDIRALARKYPDPASE
ncbi:MAG TPA: 3-hydroxyacyl-CoA dehydrogenase family protein [Bryobacteraceae bacterium]|nr:3-hydroxyacyl-CoA dehydrogenase family protein [Bryobacteraceae bacterium]